MAELVDHLRRRGRRSCFRRSNAPPSRPNDVFYGDLRGTSPACSAAKRRPARRACLSGASRRRGRASFDRPATVRLIPAHFSIQLSEPCILRHSASLPATACRGCEAHCSTAAARPMRSSIRFVAADKVVRFRRRKYHQVRRAARGPVSASRRRAMNSLIVERGTADSNRVHRLECQGRVATMVAAANLHKSEKSALRLQRARGMMPMRAIGPSRHWYAAFTVR